MALSNKDTRALRTIGHQLKPIVIISNGLSDNINKEINRALDDHELIKIKVNTAEREDKVQLVEEICSLHRAELAQLIGSVALLYRAAKRPNPNLSNLIRHKV